MSKKVILAAAGLAIAIGGFSAPSMAGPFESRTVVNTTSDSRINNMMRRLDRFEHQRQYNDSRLYVSRDSQRLAANQPAGPYRLNR